MKRLKPILFIAGGFFFGLNALEAGSRPSGEGLHGAVALALAAAFCMLEEALVGDKGACAVPSSHHYVERTYFFMNTYPLTGHVLMADGSCLCLRKRPSREDLAASLSIAGGEPADRDIVLWSSRESPIHGLDASRCLGFAVYVAFLALLVW